MFDGLTGRFRQRCVVGTLRSRGVDPDWMSPAGICGLTKTGQSSGSGVLESGKLGLAFADEGTKAHKARK